MSVAGWVLLVGVVVATIAIVALTVSDLYEAWQRRRVAAERIAHEVRLHRLAYAAALRLMTEARQAEVARRQPQGRAAGDSQGSWS